MPIASLRTFVWATCMEEVVCCTVNCSIHRFGQSWIQLYYLAKVAFFVWAFTRTTRFVWCMNGCVRVHRSKEDRLLLDLENELTHILDWWKVLQLAWTVSNINAKRWANGHSCVASLNPAVYPHAKEHTRTRAMHHLRLGSDVSAQALLSTNPHLHSPCASLMYKGPDWDQRIRARFRRQRSPREGFCRDGRWSCFRKRRVFVDAGWEYGRHLTESGGILIWASRRPRFHCCENNTRKTLLNPPPIMVLIDEFNRIGGFNYFAVITLILYSAIKNFQFILRLFSDNHIQPTLSCAEHARIRNALLHTYEELTKFLFPFFLLFIFYWRNINYRFRESCAHTYTVELKYAYSKCEHLRRYLWYYSNKITLGCPITITRLGTF